jgi:hypothetical protein
VDNVSPRPGHTPRRHSRGTKTGRDLIPLTAAEARRLFNLHTRATRPLGYHERWSAWRRRHQAAARKSHYAQRLKDRNPLL